MRQAFTELAVSTDGEGLVEITGEVAGFLAAQRVGDGLLTVFCRHTSASLLIQENADPDVRTDLRRCCERGAPQADTYVHDAEGPDDMPAHLRAALTQTQLSIPVIGGRMVLGTWQGIYLFEHRSRPHRRRVVLHIIGD